VGLGRIDVIAGDFKKGNENQYARGKFFMKINESFLRKQINITEIQRLEEASEESVISVSGAAGWGLAGNVLLGPAGLLAGLVLGGKGKNTTFVCEFKDGRKFLGTSTTKVFNEIKKHFLASSF
jgi:hypothetical protein